jgi:E3 ubiquitin-protein ligase Mdm2
MCKTRRSKLRRKGKGRLRPKQGSKVATLQAQEGCSSKAIMLQDQKTGNSEQGCSSRTAQDSGIEQSQELPRKTCVICLTKPVSTSLIHKETAHLISCYKCARTLLKRLKPCPICRRPIQQIALTFTS